MFRRASGAVAPPPKLNLSANNRHSQFISRVLLINMLMEEHGLSAAVTNNFTPECIFKVSMKTVDILP